MDEGVVVEGEHLTEREYWARWIADAEVRHAEEKRRHDEQKAAYEHQMRMTSLACQALVLQSTADMLEGVIKGCK